MSTDPTLTVAVDQLDADYLTGETVVIRADNVKVGGTLQFRVGELDPGADGVVGTADDGFVATAAPGTQPWTVTDGAAGDLDGQVNGSITTNWLVDPNGYYIDKALLLQGVDDGADDQLGTSDDSVAQATFTDAAGSTNKVYQHWADAGGPEWNNNTLNDNKSDYFEGEVIPHVYVYKASNQAPLTNGQSYSFNITYNYYQQNSNAGGFDYITTYNLSRQPGANDATNPYIPPSADSTFTNGGGIQSGGTFYTVDANITSVSSVTYTGSGSKDGHVTVTLDRKSVV